MYVYAFLKAPIDEIELPMGIEGDAILVTHHSLAALTEPDLSLENLQQSDERLMRAVLDHDRVLQDLFHYATILPLRFGTFFLSQENLVAHLQERQQQYCNQIDRLEGKAEYLVKLRSIPYTGEDAGATNAVSKTGRSYFLAKKQRYQAQTQYQQQQQDEWDEILALFREQQFDVIQGKGDEEVERVYLLGDRLLSAATTEFLQTQMTHYSTWQIQIGDPIPPYHFVG